MTLGHSSARSGKHICLACRRKSRAAMKKPKWQPQLVQCKTCRAPFIQRQAGQKYCNVECREARTNWATTKPANPRYRTSEHRRARAALIEAFRPGDPCCLCGEPMYPPTSQLHADHAPDGETYRGLAHALCNVRDGAKRGRAKQQVGGHPLDG